MKVPIMKKRGHVMKLLRKLSVLLLAIVCLFAVACGGGGSTPKIVNAEKQYDRVHTAVMEMLQEEVYTTDTQTIKITKVDYVEITNDDILTDAIGDVYYKFLYVVVEGEYTKDTGNAYAYYCKAEDSVYGVGIKDFYSNSYKDYYNYVKVGSMEGVIGEIQITE